MYQLINDSKQKIQKYSLSGTIGNISFDDENVLKESLLLSARCCDPTTFRLGGCYIGQLNISFIGVEIPRNDWYGQEITLNVEIGNTTVPVGVYTIETAEHSKSIVPVVAYDNMAKFDKAIGTGEGTFGSPFDLLSLACQSCGITLGMTQGEIEALPNGNLTLVLNEMGDIETWRDFVYWISVSLCSIATMDRSGNLVLRSFHDTVDDSIDYDVRFNTSTYGDEIVTYTGLNLYVSDEQKVEYYHTAQDDGFTLNIGNNPFFQVSKIMREDYADGILNGLSNIVYNACSVKVPFAFHYDIGDVLQFPNGQGSATNKFCIMGMTLKFNGECVLTGIPGQKQSQSKTDKNLQGLLSTVGKNEFTSYELRNAAPITIGDDETKRLVFARIAANTQTKAQIHIEVNLESEADVDFTQGIVSYLINSEDAEFYPTETWIDGKHVLHLMYILPLDANVLQTFDVYMKSMGGTIKIDRGGVWFYASGAGLVGDAKWDGSIEINEEVHGIPIPQLSIVLATDEVSFGFEINERITENGDIRTTQNGDIRILN